MTDFDIGMLLEVSVDMLRNPLWLSLIVAVIMQLFGKTIIEVLLMVAVFIGEKIIKTEGVNVSESVMLFKGTCTNVASVGVGLAISSGLVNDTYTLAEAALAALIAGFLASGGYEFVKNSFKTLGYKWK